MGPLRKLSEVSCCATCVNSIVVNNKTYCNESDELSNGLPESDSEKKEYEVKPYNICQAYCSIVEIRFEQ